MIRQHMFKKTVLTFYLSILITGCATHSVTLGTMEVWGNNEIKVDAPTKQ